VEPEDVFDAVHLKAALQVDDFLDTLLAGGRMDQAQAHATADIAYLFVEYLANTYPKLPRDATERDAWVFLFDYAMTQGPYAGAALEGAPRSLGLFVEWLARTERVREVEHLRAACRMEEYFRARLAALHAVGGGRDDPAAAAAALEGWWAELDERMRERGLAPDGALAGGSEVWSGDMGPVEAAVFDALCMLLAARARELAGRRIEGAQAGPELLRLQREFMEAPNRGLGDTPLNAIRAERARMGGGE
jgi:hypothetical protein